MSKASTPTGKAKRTKAPSIKYREDSQRSGPGEAEFDGAVQHWWEVQKYEQWLKAKAKAKADGTVFSVPEPTGGPGFGGIRGGRSMDGFRLRIIEELEKAGVPRCDIYPSKLEIQKEAKEATQEGEKASPLSTELPCYFRATKNWDLVVCKSGLGRTVASGKACDLVPVPELVLAIEFKSQFGSVGKNQNNRIEEAVGSGYDLKCAIDSGVINKGKGIRPWVGYLFVGHYDEMSWEKSVGVGQPLIPADPVFLRAAEPPVLATNVSGWSYARRYTLFLDRLREQGIYHGTCFLTTHEAQVASINAKYICPFPEHSGERFLESVRTHARKYYPPVT